MAIASTFWGEKKKNTYWGRIKEKDCFNLEFPHSKHTQTQMRVEGEFERKPKMWDEIFFLQLCDVMFGTR